MNDIFNNNNEEVAKSIMKDTKKNIFNKDEIKSWVISIVTTVIITLIIVNYVFSLTIVSGISMEPTLHTGDRLIEWKLFKYFKEPQRGDIVIIKGDLTNNENYIKRLIAVGGDTVDIINGSVYLNGEILDEPYIDKQTDVQNGNHFVVPEGYYFVMGDNREGFHSYDSRSFGPVPKSYLQGKAVFRFFPFNKFGLIK